MEDIYAGALQLLKTAPNGDDGITMAIAGGHLEPAVPDIDPMMIPILLNARDMLRSSEMRPSLNLRAYIDQGQAGEFLVRVERITGMAGLATIPDPSEHVGHCTAESAEAAVEGLRQILSQFTGQGSALTLVSRSYRTNSLAEREFSPDRENTARASRRWRDVLKPLRDAELSAFVGEVVDKAFAWGGDTSKAQSLSLWFYVNGGYDAVYTTITINEDGGFGLEIEDRVCWPWREKKKRLRTQQDVRNAIANQLDTHGFQLKSAKVYFNHSQRLAA